MLPGYNEASPLSASPALPDTRPAPLPGPAAFAALVALAVAHVFAVPIAAGRNGDFVHLWAGGRALQQGGGAALYDPRWHKALITEALGALPPDLWSSRNDALANLDSIAYVRFASVYKNFREVRDFENFIGTERLGKDGELIEKD